MKLFTAAISLFLAVAPSLSAPPSPFMGTIQAPVPDTTIVADTPFPFNYEANNWCEEGYNFFKVFLTEGTTPPAISAVDDNGNVAGALMTFGNFTVANFGEQMCCVEGNDILT